MQLHREVRPEHQPGVFGLGGDLQERRDAADARRIGHQVVGGAVADAIGDRLARLAMGAQVLVVTHSPQVAARGATHWRVQKRTIAKGGAATTTSVEVLDDAARREEIARMLAGAEVTDAARAAADSLMTAGAGR